MAKYRCTLCGYEFEGELTKDFVCPECGAPAEDFELVVEEEKAAPAAEVKAEKAAPSQASKPHSHVQEKTGVPQNAQPAESTKKNPAKDTSKHYHPRDMK